MKTYTLRSPGEAEEFYKESIEKSSPEELIAALKDRRIVKYRTRTVRAGQQVYVDVYPVWKTGGGLRTAREKLTRDAQCKVNRRNALRRAVWIVNQNFNDDGYWCTVTYNNDFLPKSEEEAKGNFRKYLRVLKYRARTKYGVVLKCLWVTVWKDARCHHHFLTNYPNRDEMESLWRFGGRNCFRKLVADEYGYEGVVTYIMQSGARYSVTRNMEKYMVSVADGKITRGKAMKLVFGEEDSRAFFEKNYPLCTMSDVRFKLSDMFGGVYIRVRMKRKE